MNRCGAPAFFVPVAFAGKPARLRKPAHTNRGACAVIQAHARAMEREHEHNSGGGGGAPVVVNVQGGAPQMLIKPPPNCCMKCCCPPCAVWMHEVSSPGPALEPPKMASPKHPKKWAPTLAHFWTQNDPKWRSKKVLLFWDPFPAPNLAPFWTPKGPHFGTPNRPPSDPQTAAKPL